MSKNADRDSEIAEAVASPYQPVEFRLKNGRVISVTLREDEDEVSVMLHGPRCGELIVVPSAGNSIRVRSSGPGMKNDQN